MAAACGKAVVDEPPLDGSGRISVVASLETEPVPSGDDAADDPAIWVDPHDPARSLVIGTDKRWGLDVYDLSGHRVEALEIGNINNVDLRVHPWGEDFTLVVGSERLPSRLVLLRLDHETRRLTLLRQHPLDLPAPYGVCIGLDSEERPLVVLNDKDGRFLQLSVSRSFDIEVVRTWRTETQPEGCVVDEPRNRVFFGEENRGIWWGSFEPDEPMAATLLDSIEGQNLTADVEGLAIAVTPLDTYLLASSQGDSTFAVYSLTDDALVGRFTVGEGAVDAVSGTDGLDATGIALPGFPGGLVVVQDDVNTPSDNQNFKFIDFDTVLEVLLALRDE